MSTKKSRRITVEKKSTKDSRSTDMVASEACVISEVDYDISEAGRLVLAALERSMRRPVTAACVQLTSSSQDEVSLTLESTGGISFCLKLDTTATNWREKLERTVREVGHVGCS